MVQDLKMPPARQQEWPTCFHELMDNVTQGKRRFERFRHFKLYSLSDSATPSLPTIQPQEQQ